MKNTIFTLLLSSIIICSFGQISIINTDMPVSGDTLRFSTAATTDTALLNHNYKIGGAKHLWDFSGLKPIEQGVDTFKTQQQAPYKLSFFGKYALKQDNILILTDVYDYYENSVSAFSVMGKGLTANITTTVQLTGNYSVKDKVYQFPLSFSDRDSSTFSVNATALGLITYSSEGYRINEVDGWGSIKTPFGTFACLRVKTTYVSFDTITQSLFPFPIGIKTQRLEYKWLAKGQHIPILEVTGTLNALTGTFTLSKVRFRDIKRNVVSPNAPKADFTADKTTPTNIETVTFTNKTTGPVFPLPTYFWSFTPADYEFMGGTTATSRNPKVLFSKPGYYTVKLQASNSSGSDDTIKINYINVLKNTLNLPTAAFMADKTNPYVTDTVNFTNTSSVAVTTSYRWTVTPNTFTFINCNDTFPNTSIKFYGAGKYTITLFANNFYGSDSIIKKDYILAKYPLSVKNDQKNLTQFSINPNPIVSGTLNLSFSLASKSNLLVELYDLKGAKVAGLINSNYNSGEYNLNFNLSAYKLLNSVYYLKVINEQTSNCYKVLFIR